MDRHAYSVEVDRDMKEQTDTAERQNGRRPRNFKFRQGNQMLQTCDVYWRTSWPVQLVTAHQIDVDACLLVHNLSERSS